MRNGAHTISAELEVGVDMADGSHGHETVTTREVNATFANEDFVAVSIEGLGAGAMNASTGQVWYGGPTASVVINALPVLYSSGAVSSLTLLSFCRAPAATDSAAPFSFAVNCKGTSPASGDTPMFTVGGTPIMPRGVGAVYLDFEGPDAPHFHVNPNKREEGWVNASVNFTGEQGSGSKADGWLVYNDANAGVGVGGYTPQIRFAPAGTGNKVGGALAAPPLTQLVLPLNLAGQSSAANAFCVVVSAIDLLGQ